MQDNSLLNNIAEQFMGKKGAPKYPYILARRNEPEPLPYCIHDVGGWEGLRSVQHNRKQSWEIDRNFTLVIYEDGSCFIPDTPNNRAKLEKLSQPLIEKKEHTRRNGVTNELETIRTEIVIPPAYERVDKNLFENTVIDDLAGKVMARMQEMQAQQAGSLEPQEPEETIRESNVGGKRTTKTTVRVDPLLEPVPRKRVKG